MTTLWSLFSKGQVKGVHTHFHIRENTLNHLQAIETFESGSRVKKNEKQRNLTSDLQSFQRECATCRSVNWCCGFVQIFGNGVLKEKRERCGPKVIVYPWKHQCSHLFTQPMSFSPQVPQSQSSQEGCGRCLSDYFLVIHFDISISAREVDFVYPRFLFSISRTQKCEMIAHRSVGTGKLELKTCTAFWFSINSRSTVGRHELNLLVSRASRHQT